ncbi:MAG TPA: cupin domain-containing protein [Terracidiphilus sp.]|jgi:mannose-6-phosphate isomerase-like protein (cupin superfamily)|nr:cupin domain-containing protein [Terracidiphilus sp.]
MNSARIAPLLAGGVMGSTDSSFAVAEWQADASLPGPPQTIAPLHLHHRDDEGWYVLEGKLCVQVGEEKVDVPAGSGVLVPKGTKHTYWNPDPVPARYLLFMTPRILGLIEALHSLPDRNRETVEALFAQFDSQLVD